MKVFLFLTLFIISCSLPQKCVCQSLRELEMLTIGLDIDDAEVKMNKWDYKFEKKFKVTTDNINYDVYAFKRDSPDWYYVAAIFMYKKSYGNVPSMYFGVKYITHSEKKFIELKNEIFSKNELKKTAEETEGTLFSRQYESEGYIYVLGIDTPLNNSEPKSYTVYINYDLLRALTK